MCAIYLRWVRFQGIMSYDYQKEKEGKAGKQHSGLLWISAL
jgi:hypothetical protein